MDPRFLRILRPIAAVVVAVFTWISFEPWNYALWFQTSRSAHAATAPSQKTQSSAGKFEENLRGVQNLVRDLDRDLSEDKDITLTLESLKGHKKALEEADVEIRKEFSETEAFLKEKKLPPVILDRHHKAVADYDGNYRKLKVDLDEIESLDKDREAARKKRDDRTLRQKRDDLKKRVRALKEDLETKVQKPRHQPLDPNNLPHRAAKPTKRKPRLKKEEFTEFLPENKPVPVAYDGGLPEARFASHTPGADLPTPADLAETIEVQFTPEINALAAELDHNPVKIYNWVHNNIDFTPTWGSIQGANHCLLTKQCNAFDTSSLLIALLRTSGIPARYVMGTIEVPIDQFMNWVGDFTDANAALTFAASGGIPTTGLQQGGTIKAARLEHVWAEGYVDYIPSRGAVNGEGDTWIRLDPTFKQYMSTSGVAIESAISVDQEVFFNQIATDATLNETDTSVTNLNVGYIELALSDIKSQLLSYLGTNFPTATLDEVLGKREILQISRRLLLNSSPYKQIVRASEFQEIDESLRHEISFGLLDEFGFNTAFVLKKSLPELAGKMIGVAYAPASSADEALINSFFPEPHSDGSPVTADEMPSILPGYLIDLRPELIIDNQVVAFGSTVQMGTSQKLVFTFSEPNNTSDRIENIIIAGEYSGIALNLGGISNSQIIAIEAQLENTKSKVDAPSEDETLTKHETIGQLMYASGITYLAEVDKYNDILAKVLGLRNVRLPSETRYYEQLSADYLFGVPSLVKESGLGMDADRLSSAVRAFDGSVAKEYAYNLLTGIMSSVYENGVAEFQFYETSGNLRGISAADAIAQASSEGIPIYLINKHNYQSLISRLAIDSLVISDVINAVNAGYEVVIPGSNISREGWSGVGYIVIDPVTGSGAYRISGGTNGMLYAVIIGIVLLTIAGVCATGVGCFIGFGIIAPLFILVLAYFKKVADERVKQCLIEFLFPLVIGLGVALIGPALTLYRPAAEADAIKALFRVLGISSAVVVSGLNKFTNLQDPLGTVSYYKCLRGDFEL